MDLLDIFKFNLGLRKLPLPPDCCVVVDDIVAVEMVSMVTDGCCGDVGDKDEVDFVLLDESLFLRKLPLENPLLLLLLLVLLLSLLMLVTRFFTLFFDLRKLPFPVPNNEVDEEELSGLSFSLDFLKLSLMVIVLFASPLSLALNKLLSTTSMLPIHESDSFRFG